MLLHIPRELLTIIISFSNTSSRFSLKHVAISFKTIITKLYPELESPILFKTLNQIHIEAVEYPDLFKWLIPDPHCFCQEYFDFKGLQNSLIKRYMRRYFKHAVLKGSLEIVKYVPKDFWSGMNPDSICCIAAKSGNLEVLTWVYEKYIASTDCDYKEKVSDDDSCDNIYTDDDISLDTDNDDDDDVIEIGGLLRKPNTCTEAAKIGHIGMLKFLYEQGCPLNENTLVQAANHGHLEVLKWLQSVGCIRQLCENANPWACTRAAENGHFEIVKWLHINGCFWNEHTCSYAAEGGHFEILKYLFDNGCPWNSQTFASAAMNGDFEMLVWLFEHKCPWNDDTFDNAVEHGDIEILKWLHKNGCPWNKTACSNAACNDHFEILRWLRENGCPWNSDWISYPGVHSNNLPMLKWIRETDKTALKLNSMLFSVNVFGGNLEILDYIFKNGCEFNRNMYESAAIYGHLDALKWMNERGFQMLDNLCTKAVDGGHFEILKWLLSESDGHKPCTLHQNIYESIVTVGRIDILKYVYEHDPQLFWNMRKNQWYRLVYNAVRNDNLEIARWIYQTRRRKNT